MMNTRGITSTLSSQYMEKTIDYLFENIERLGRFEEHRLDFWTHIKGHKKFNEYHQIFLKLRTSQNLTKEMTRKSNAFIKHHELAKDGNNKVIKPRARAIVSPPGAIKLAQIYMGHAFKNLVFSVFVKAEGMSNAEMLDLFV